VIGEESLAFMIFTFELLNNPLTLALSLRERGILNF
jgi:hypothetical protein